jgi:hypothetical protein
MSADWRTSQSMKPVHTSRSLRVEAIGIEKGEGLFFDVWLQTKERLAHDPRGEAEHLAVEPWILPSTVVDEIGAVDVLEDDVVSGFDERAGGLLDHQTMKQVVARIANHAVGHFRHRASFKKAISSLSSRASGTFSAI